MIAAGHSKEQIIEEINKDTEKDEGAFKPESDALMAFISSSKMGNLLKPAAGFFLCVQVRHLSACWSC